MAAYVHLLPKMRGAYVPMCLFLVYPSGKNPGSQAKPLGSILCRRGGFWVLFWVLGSIPRRRGGSWVLFCGIVAGPGFYSVPSWRVLGSILCRRAGSWVLFCAVVGYVPSSGFPSDFKVLRRILRFFVKF